MSKKAASRLIQARIPYATYRRLLQAAAKEGISTAAYIRRSLMREFDFEARRFDIDDELPREGEEQAP